MSTFLASMDNDNWLSSNIHFASISHNQAYVKSASAPAVNHHGTIYKSFTVNPSYQERHCASLCFVHSSSGTICHFYLLDNNNCYLGNAFNTNGLTLPAIPWPQSQSHSFTNTKTNESKDAALWRRIYAYIRVRVILYRQ